MKIIMNLNDLSSIVDDIENAQEYCQSLYKNLDSINELEDNITLNSDQIEKIKSYLFSAINILQKHY